MSCRGRLPAGQRWAPQAAAAAAEAGRPSPRKRQRRTQEPAGGGGQGGEGGQAGVATPTVEAAAPQALRAASPERPTPAAAAASAVPVATATATAAAAGAAAGLPCTARHARPLVVGAGPVPLSPLPVQARGAAPAAAAAAAAAAGGAGGAQQLVPGWLLAQAQERATALEGALVAELVFGQKLQAELEVGGWRAGRGRVGG